MKFAFLLLALSPAVAAQAAVVRSVTAEETFTDQDLAQAGYPRDLLTFGGPLPVVPGFFDLPTLDGLRPLAVEFDYESSAVLRASQTNTQSTVVEDGLFAIDVIGVAAGPSDEYGPLSLISAASLGNNSRSETFQPGETRTVEMFPFNNIIPPLLSIRYEPDSPIWCQFETACPSLFPPYLCGIQMIGAGSLTGECIVNWAEARIEHTSRITAEVALDEVVAGVRTFCGPTPSLSPVELRAFGSIAAGTDWLSMRVEGVPAGAPVAVVGASAVTTVVASPMGVCIGGTRLAQSVAFADDLGATTQEVSLATFAPGDRVAFQALYRTATGWDVSTGLLVEVQ
ncbi:MAG: hypothetical protein AAGB93_03675 [Planctomycetota bacterium]